MKKKLAVILFFFLILSLRFQWRPVNASDLSSGLSGSTVTEFSEKILPPNSASDNVFGKEAAVSGDVMAVSSSHDVMGDVVYVYYRNEGGSNNWGYIATLEPDTEDSILFGASIAVDGETIIVGAPNYHVEGELLGYQGAVYVYYQHRGGTDNWGLYTRLNASDMVAYDHFGTDVSIENGTLVVGTPGVVGEQGAAYIFYQDDPETYSFWTEIKKLTAWNAYPSAEYGRNVALSDNTLVIAAPGMDYGALEEIGTLYIYYRDQAGSDQWGQVTYLEAYHIENANLGHSLALDGGTLVAGSHESDHEEIMYVFHRNEGGTDAWGEVATLRPSQAHLNDFYGRSAAIYGDEILVGASWQNLEGFYRVGCVYRYGRHHGGMDVWGEMEMIVPANSQGGEEFGTALDLTAETIAIGAPYDHTAGPYVGAVYANRTPADSADLSVIKGGMPDTVDPAGTVTYTLSVTNAGPDTAQQVSVFDRYTNGMTFQSATGVGWDCNDHISTVTCTRDNLAEGAAPDITLTFLAPSDPGYILNTASVTSMSGDPDLSNNDTDDSPVVTKVGVFADLSIMKSASPDPIPPGSTLTYTLSINNAGPDSAEDPVIVDTLPAGVTFQSADGVDWTCNEEAGTVTCTRSTLELGEAPDVTVVVLAPATSGLITNHATVTATTFDTATDNNTDTTTSTVGSGADLSLSKTGLPDPVSPGGLLTYTLSVINTGPDESVDLSVIDHLPSGVHFQSASGPGWDCEENDGTVTCTRASQPVGNAPEIIIEVLAPSINDVISNVASVSALSYDPDLTNNDNSASPVVTEVREDLADLSLSMTGTPDTVTAGGMITYTISVTNHGTEDAASIEVTDPFPSGATIHSALGAEWTCGETGGILTCTRESLPVGDMSDIVIEVIAPVTPGIISNIASVSALTDDPDETNNDNSANPVETTVLRAADLELTKEAAPQTVSPGKNLTYTLTVTNHGPDPADNVTVTDDLAENLSFLSANGVGWACGESGTVVTCTMTSMPVGTSTIVIELLAPADGFGSVDNTAMVGTTSIDADSENNSAGPVTVTEKVISVNLSLTTTPASQEIQKGESTDVALSVGNAGPDVASDVILVVNLPTGLTYLDASGSGWTCGFSAPELTCTRPDLPVASASEIILSVQGDQPGTFNGSGAISSTEVDDLPSNNVDVFTVDVLETAYEHIFFPFLLR